MVLLLVVGVVETDGGDDSTTVGRATFLGSRRRAAALRSRSCRDRPVLDPLLSARTLGSTSSGTQRRLAPAQARPSGSRRRGRPDLGGDLEAGPELQTDLSRSREPAPRRGRALSRRDAANRPQAVGGHGAARAAGYGGGRLAGTRQPRLEDEAARRSWSSAEPARRWPSWKRSCGSFGPPRDREAAPRRSRGGRGGRADARPKPSAPRRRASRPRCSRSHERLRARLPDGVAVSELVGTSCTGCHTTLAAMEVERHPSRASRRDRVLRALRPHRRPFLTRAHRRASRSHRGERRGPLLGRQDPPSTCSASNRRDGSLAPSVPSTASCRVRCAVRSRPPRCSGSPSRSTNGGPSSTTASSTACPSRAYPKRCGSNGEADSEFAPPGGESIARAHPPCAQGVRRPVRRGAERHGRRGEPCVADQSGSRMGTGRRAGGRMAHASSTPHRSRVSQSAVAGRSCGRSTRWRTWREPAHGPIGHPVGTRPLQRTVGRGAEVDEAEHQRGLREADRPRTRGS